MSATYDEGSCDARVVHGVKLASLRKLMAEDEEVRQQAERFKVLGDPTRLKILLALSHMELCVCDIANLLNVTQTSASQHLKILRAYGLVRFQKRGRMAFYRLTDSSLDQALSPMHTKGASFDGERRTV